MGFFVNQDGATSATIGGVRLIKDFNDTQIVVSVKGGSVEVTGDNLEIVAFSENEVQVTGKIANITTHRSKRDK